MASASGRDVNADVQKTQLDINTEGRIKPASLAEEVAEGNGQSTPQDLPVLQADDHQVLEAPLNTSDLIDISLSLVDDNISEEWFYGQQTGDKHCNICSKEFADPKALIRHIQYVHHTEKKFQCPMCKAAFKQLTHLRTHLRMHTGEKPFQCPECGSRFARNSTMKVHLRHYCKHAKPQDPIDKPSDAVSDNISTQEQIPGDASSYTNICPLCGQVFASSRGLSRHMSSCGTSQLKCSFCGASTFKTIQELQTHSLTHMQSQLFTCTRCSAVFMDYSKYSQHLRNHTERRPFQCTLCGKAFKQSGHLRDHIRSHTGDRPFKCSDCGKSFLRKFQLKQHALTRSCNPDALKNLSESAVDDDEQEEKFPLDLSADKPVSNENYGNHHGFNMDMLALDSFIQQRNSEKEIPGDNKDNELERVNKDTRHEETNSVNDKLTKEVEEEKQLPLALYECFVCKSVFSSEIDLKTHQYITMHLETLTYKCEKCEEVFQDTKSLSQHMRSHAGNDRPYTCSHCGDSFKESHHLKYHILVHTGERPYKCDYCPSAFARQYQLKCHLEKHERGEILPLDLQESKAAVDLSLPAGPPSPKRPDETPGSNPVPGTCIWENSLKSSNATSQSQSMHISVAGITATPESSIPPVVKASITKEENKPSDPTVSGPDAVDITPMNIPLVSPMYYLPSAGLPMPMINIGSLGLPPGLVNMTIPGLVPPAGLTTPGLVPEMETPPVSVTGASTTTLTTPTVVSMATSSTVTNSSTTPVTNLASVPANSRHLGIPTAERPHVCNICGKGFKLRHHLKEHLRTHTDDKPYKCEHCGGSYARKSQLNSHLRRRHGLTVPSLSPGAMSPGSSTLSSSPNAVPQWLPNQPGLPISQPTTMPDTSSSIVTASETTVQAGIDNSYLTNMLPTMNLISDLQQRQMMLSSWYGAMMANITATQQLLGLGTTVPNLSETAESIQVAAEAVLNSESNLIQNTLDNNNGISTNFVANDIDMKESLASIAPNLENEEKSNSESTLLPQLQPETKETENNGFIEDDNELKNNILYTCHICKQTFHEKGALTSHLQDHSFEDILNASLFKSPEDGAFQLGAVVDMMT